MNAPDPLSQRARQLFEHASERLDADTLRRLRSVRRGVLARAPTASGALPWFPVAAATSLALAVGLGLWLQPPTSTSPPPDLPALSNADDAALLDEDPEIYAWLADAPVGKGDGGTL